MFWKMEDNLIYCICEGLQMFEKESYAKAKLFQVTIDRKEEENYSTTTITHGKKGRWHIIFFKWKIESTVFQIERQPKGWGSKKVSRRKSL